MANKVKKSTAKTAGGSIFSLNHIINVSSLGEGGGPTGGTTGTAGSGTELYTGAEFEDYKYLVYTPTTKTKSTAEMDAYYGAGNHPYVNGRTWTGTVKRISNDAGLINYFNSKGASGGNLWEVLTWARDNSYLVLNKEYTAISGTWAFEGTEVDPLPNPPLEENEYPTAVGNLALANMGGYLRFRPNGISIRFSLQDAEGNKFGGSIASSRPGTLWRFYLESDPTKYNMYEQVNTFSFGNANIAGNPYPDLEDYVDHYSSPGMNYIPSLSSDISNAITPSAGERVVAEAGGLPTENMLFHIDGQYAPSYPQLGRTSSNQIDKNSNTEDRSWYDLGDTQHIFRLFDLQGGEPLAVVTDTTNGPLFTASQQTAYAQNATNTANVSVLGDFATNTSGTLTTSFWIKPNDVTEHGIMCLGLGDDTERGKWKITSSGEVEYTIDNSISVTSSAITAGNWVNITTVREGVNLKIYINGVEDAAITNSTSSSNVNGFQGTIIGYGGGTTYEPTEYYDGLFGTVTMWNTALTSLQIAQHIGATAPLQ